MNILWSMSQSQSESGWLPLNSHATVGTVDTPYLVSDNVACMVHSLVRLLMFLSQQLSITMKASRLFFFNLFKIFFLQFHTWEMYLHNFSPFAPCPTPLVFSPIPQIHNFFFNYYCYILMHTYTHNCWVQLIFGAACDWITYQGWYLEKTDFISLISH